MKHGQILRGEEGETKCKGGREVLLGQLVTAEPTYALLPSQRANWHLQCENSSLCTPSHKTYSAPTHTRTHAHTHTHTHTTVYTDTRWGKKKTSHEEALSNNLKQAIMYNKDNY